MSKVLATYAGAAIVIALALLSPSAVHAQNAQQACAADIQQYCAGVAEGDGRIARCLHQNEQKLSPACQSRMRATAGLMKEVVAACEDDVHRYCADAAPGTTRQCLRANFRELSPTCKRELFEAKKAM